jgi:hypothetical protein
MGPRPIHRRPAAAGCRRPAGGGGSAGRLDGAGRCPASHTHTHAPRQPPPHLIHRARGPGHVRPARPPRHSSCEHLTSRDPSRRETERGENRGRVTLLHVSTGPEMSGTVCSCYTGPAMQRMTSRRGSSSSGAPARRGPEPFSVRSLILSRGGDRWTEGGGDGRENRTDGRRGREGGWEERTDGPRGREGQAPPLSAHDF